MFELKLLDSAEEPSCAGAKSPSLMATFNIHGQDILPVIKKNRRPFKFNKYYLILHKFLENMLIQLENIS